MNRIGRSLSVVCIATALGVLAACGGDSGDTGSSSAGGNTEGVSDATERVDQATQATEDFEAPGKRFDASKAKGKTIFMIAPMSIPFVQENVKGLEEAAELVGAKVVTFDGKAQVNDYSRGIDQAIAQKADVILIESLPVSLFEAQLKRAEDAGIPVISVENHDPGPPPSSDPNAVVASVDQCHACAGRSMADYVIADSEGSAKAIAIWSSDVGSIGKPQLEAIKDEFAELCADCSLEVVDAPLAQWSTRLSGLTRSTLTANPDADYLLPLYDGMVAFIEPAIKQANATDRVKIVSFNASPSVMKSMNTGETVVADVGVGNVRFGWAIADQAFRVLAGSEPVTDPKVPTRLFTKDEVDALDLDGPSETWFGDPSVWRDGYQTLWGL